MSRSKSHKDLPNQIGRLGALIRAYTNDEEARRRDLNFGWFFVGLGAFITLTGFLVFLSDIFGPEYRTTAVAYCLAPALLLGLWIAARGLPVLRMAYRNRSIALGIYQKGFAVFQNNRLQIFRWTDVESITKKIETNQTPDYHITHVYEIAHKAESGIILDDRMPDVMEIVYLIEENVYPRLIGRLVRKFERGEPVIFGPVELNPYGIFVNGEHFQWDNVKAVVASNGDLQIREKVGGIFKRKAAIKNTDVPNLRILLGFLNSIRVRKQDDTGS